MVKEKNILILELNQLKQQIEEIGIPVDKICESLCGIKWNKNANTFYEMELDELDVIGLVIEIEKDYNLNVSDLVLYEILRIKPDSLIAGLRRNERLDELGI